MLVEADRGHMGKPNSKTKIYSIINFHYIMKAHACIFLEIKESCHQINVVKTQKRKYIYFINFLIKLLKLKSAKFHREHSAVWFYSPPYLPQLKLLFY